MEMFRDEMAPTHRRIHVNVNDIKIKDVDDLFPELKEKDKAYFKHFLLDDTDTHKAETKPLHTPHGKAIASRDESEEEEAVERKKKYPVVIPPGWKEGEEIAKCLKKQIELQTNGKISRTYSYTVSLDDVSKDLKGVKAVITLARGGFDNVKSIKFEPPPPEDPSDPPDPPPPLPEKLKLNSTFMNGLTSALSFAFPIPLPPLSPSDRQTVSETDDK